MFRRIAIIKKPNSLELAQVFRRALKRPSKAPCKKTDAHVHIWNFVLVSHNLNIDYLHKKTRRDFVSKQKKSPKRIMGVPRPGPGAEDSLNFYRIFTTQMKTARIIELLFHFRHSP